MLRKKLFFYVIYLIPIILIVLIINSCGKKIIIDKFLKNGDEGSVYGKNFEKNFYIKDSLKIPLKISTKIDLKGGLNFSSIKAMDNLAVIGDLKGNVYAINLSDEKITHYMNFKQPIITSIIVQEKQLIFPLASIKEQNSKIIFYDLIRGESRVIDILDGSVEKELLMDDKKNVYVITVNGFVIKISQNQKIEWKIDLKKSFYSQPIIYDKKIIVGSTDGTIYFITLDGKIEHKFSIQKVFRSGYFAKGGFIYFADEEGNLYKFDYANNKILNKTKLEAAIRSIPSLDDENIFIGDLKGNVYNISQSTFEVNWKKSIGGIINNTILIVGDVLVVPDFSGKLILMDKNNGELVQKFEFNGRVKLAPVYIKDKIITGYDDRKIVFLSN